MTHHDPEHPSPESDRRLSELLGGLTDVDFERVDPPAGLLGRITAQAAAEHGVAAEHGAPSGADAAASGSSAPVVISMDERRRPRSFLFAAAAAVLLVVAAVGAMLATRAPVRTERQLARAELEQLEPLGSTRATARLVVENGTTHLHIDASDMAPAPAGSKYELWLIDRGVTDPRSLGTITGTEDVVVPSSIDPDQYAIVDISLEPDDGNHAHSGHSLMRGTLT